jgi:hypothetical protein
MQPRWSGRGSGMRGAVAQDAMESRRRVALAEDKMGRVERDAVFVAESQQYQWFMVRRGFGECFLRQCNIA